MGDLISRRDVLELLYKIFDEYRLSTDKNTSIGIGKSFGTDVFEEIRNMPTAYSVDKSVKELEEFLINYGVSENSRVHQRIIEIVKQCGVSDDVCEWKYTKEIMDNAEFKVGCNQNALKRGIVPNNFSYHDFKYCPYCGKKIKVVE